MLEIIYQTSHWAILHELIFVVAVAFVLLYWPCDTSAHSHNHCALASASTGSCTSADDVDSCSTKVFCIGSTALFIVPQHGRKSRHQRIKLCHRLILGCHKPIITAVNLV